MSEVSASLVKTLREKTGAGMMDCKKALSEVNGDLEEAVDWLRKKGLAAAAKKSSRVAAEGLVGVATSGTTGAVVEVNAETDFVARNDQFQGLVEAAVKTALQVGDDVETLKAASCGIEGRKLSEHVTHLVATIGENMNVRRAKVLKVGQGVVASYVHGAVIPNLGRIGVLVALESAASAEKLNELGRQIAMHIAAASPQALDIASVDQDALARERTILTDQAKASGRPADIIEKMVEGRVRKYYEEVVLLEQVFVIDGQRKVSQVVEDTAKELGHPIKLVAFECFRIGEGIEKEESNFAQEVAAQLGA